MKQTIRKYTFETNSSSTHSLTLIKKEDLEAFENGYTYFYPEMDKFVNKDEIVNLSCFKAEYPKAEEMSEDELEAALDEFKDEFIDGDYSYLFSYRYLDYCTVSDLKDKEGEDVVAFSYYING